MNIKFFLVLACLSLVLTSCLSTKKLKYLQDNSSTVDSMAVQTLQKPYRIQVNDLLSIRVKAMDQELVGMFNPIGEENANVTGEERMYYDGFAVNRHGNIRIPTLGEINVLGFTLEEVRTKIEAELLENYYKAEANIFVTVKLAGIRYTIMGEITNPGSQVLYKEQVSIMEAVANAGDIAEFGDRENVVIVRQYPSGQKKHYVDLTSIEATNSPYYYIQPNDLILVNPLPQKSLGLGTTGLQTFTTVLSVLTTLATLIVLYTRL